MLHVLRVQVKQPAAVLNDGIAAMQEDSLMAAHDASKDGLGLAANYGIYNLSGDMLQCAGYSGNGNLNSKEEQTKWNWSLNHLKVIL
jgi:hypothetical protein